MLINEVARFKKIAGLITEDTNVASLIDQIKELDADSMQQLLSGLGMYFEQNEESLGNMDAAAVGQHINKAAALVRQKTGN